jgi:hypothetical protein
MTYAFGALGGRSHLLQFQWVAAILCSIRCISDPKVPLESWRFEIISEITSTRANPSKGWLALAARPYDGV